jgi:hypothetical protein
MVRAKFRVNGITDGTYDGKPSKTISMVAVFASKEGIEGNACEENQIFGKYTPDGSLRMTIPNPAAYNYFEPNKEYYLDFTGAFNVSAEG